jgi:hypothetical protein
MIKNMSLMYSLLNENTDYDYDNYGYDDNELFEESGTYFCEGVDGLFEISAESEASWGNIMCETLLAEHIASFNEDVEMLQEADDSFFKKVQEWVKDKARKLKQFFTNLINRVKLAVMNVQKFYAANKSRFGKAVTIKSNRKWKKISIHDLGKEIQNGLLCLDGLAKITNKAMSSDEIATQVGSKLGIKISKASELRTEYAKSIVETTKDSENIKINDVAKYANNLAGAKIVLANVQAYQKHTNDILSQILKTAKIEDKDNYKTDKSKLVSFKKNCSSVADSVTGVGTSLLLQLVSDSLKIAKASIKRGENPDAAPTEKKPNKFKFDTPTAKKKPTSTNQYPDLKNSQQKRDARKDLNYRTDVAMYRNIGML